uniref:Thioredoxin domain-containing protein n=1 Tax=Panagrolaimus sp. JU765 TaxID=591449 RepID=A0AC34RI79_9BILA
MGLKLGDKFPDFKAETSEGPIESFHEWIGDGNWAILFSHPADFTPVCTTELARVAQIHGDFEARKTKLIALSCDSVETHKKWIPDIVAYCYRHSKTSDGAKFCPKEGDCHKGKEAETIPYPIIADEKRELATQLGMLDPEEKDAEGIPLAARAVFIIDPSRHLKLSILYPATTGRNFDEILRVLDSLQLTAHKKVATPADWKFGNDCMVLPSLSDEEAAQLFGKDNIKPLCVPSGKHYLRLTPQP